jgi:hypothetical protein
MIPTSNPYLEEETGDLLNPSSGEVDISFRNDELTWINLVAAQLSLIFLYIGLWIFIVIHRGTFEAPPVFEAVIIITPIILILSIVSHIRVWGLYFTLVFTTIIGLILNIILLSFWGDFMSTYYYYNHLWWQYSDLCTLKFVDKGSLVDHIVFKDSIINSTFVWSDVDDIQPFCYRNVYHYLGYPEYRQIYISQVFLQCTSPLALIGRALPLLSMIINPLIV